MTFIIGSGREVFISMRKQKMTHWQTALLVCATGIGLAVAAGCAPDIPPAVAAQGSDVPALPAPDLYSGSPYLGELRNSLVYGEIWERPQLSKRDRSLITVAVLQALVRDELTLHIPRGLDNGLTPEEISEIILHVTFYAGWPTGVQASLTAAEAFENRGLSLGELPRATPETHASTPSALSDAYAAVPRLGALRNSLLYGDIWERPLLSKRDRSLITVAVNQALYATSELRTHINRALDENGVTPQEISEVILHVTFYAGWPAAVNAGRLATAAFEARGVDLSQLR
jgi:4-carboxymuconolactone decarboxylase